MKNEVELCPCSLSFWLGLWVGRRPRAMQDLQPEHRLFGALVDGMVLGTASEG